MANREVCHAHAGERVGRPSALTPEVCERIVQAKKAGAPDWVAARSAGISRTTYYQLRKRGEAEESGPARELYEAIGRAEADAYLHAMASWRRQMAGNWRACVAYVDRVDRGRLTSDRGSSPNEPPGEERVDATAEVDIADPETRRLLDELLARRAAGS